VVLDEDVEALNFTIKVYSDSPAFRLR
jgi:hypothetical protein